MAGAVTDRPALVWRSAPTRFALAAAPIWFTTAVLVFSAPLPMKATVGALAGLTIVSPVNGLLATAFAAPLGTLFGTVAGLEGFRLTESMVLAFLGGWLLRAPRDRRGPRVAAAAGWLLAATAALSVVAQVWDLSQFDGILSDVGGSLFYGYYMVRDRIGFADAARIAEGVGLTVAVVSLFRSKPSLSISLPASLAASATVAALASLLLWKGIATDAILKRHALIGYRVSAHVADVNAAASFYSLILCASLGMAVRATGRARVLWLTAAAACGVGIWLSDSRSAAGAVSLVIAAAVAWFLTANWRARTKLILVSLVVGIVLAAGLLRIRQLSTDPDYRGAGFREQFNATSLRAIGSRPWSGIGVGQYLADSPLFMSPQIAFSYGAENAHNYFLQIAAELGVPGLAAFLAWVGVGLWRGFRGLAIDPRDVRLLGHVAGVVALLGTSTTGHPLLVDEVATPFWMLFGLMTALAGSAALHGHDESTRAPAAWLAWLVIAAAAAIALAQAIARPELRPVESRAVDGLYEWETGADGVRFRWTGEYGSVFVPADVTRIYLPVRMPAVSGGPPPMIIEARTTGAPGQRIVIGDEWATLNLELPDAVPPQRFKRINIRAERPWKPALFLAGNADMRLVGVQLGEIRSFREH